MMDEKQNNQADQIAQARDLLSAYLDGEVTAAERDVVEAGLAQSAELRQELAALRQTVQLLADMPRARAPRPFTLTLTEAGLPARSERKSIFSQWFKPMMGAAATIATVLIVGFLALNLLSPADFRQDEAASVAFAPVAEEEPAAQKAMAESAPAESSAAESLPVEIAELEIAKESEAVTSNAIPTELLPIALEAEAADAVAEGEAMLEAPQAPAAARAADGESFGVGGGAAESAPAEKVSVPQPVAEKSVLLATETPAPAPTATVTMISIATEMPPLDATITLEKEEILPTPTPDASPQFPLARTILIVLAGALLTIVLIVGIAALLSRPNR